MNLVPLAQSGGFLPVLPVVPRHGRNPFLAVGEILANVLRSQEFRAS